MAVNGLYFVLTFFLGFFIGAPVIISVIYLYLISYAKKPKVTLKVEKEIDEIPPNEKEISSSGSADTPITKVGWLRIKSQEKRKSSGSNNLQQGSGASSPDTVAPPQPYFAGLINSGLSLLEKKTIGPPPVNKRQKDEYYCVLKMDQLMLYESPKRVECRGVILLSQYTVSIYPAGLADYQLFRKEHPILLRFRVNPNDSNTSSSSNENAKVNGAVSGGSFITGTDYFIYVDSPVEKESWFVALLNGSKATSKGNYGEPLVFDRSALETLIENLNQSESHLNTQWFNGFLGRIFLGVYKTQTVKDYLITKISSKLAKIKTPTFLGPIHVRDIHVGDSLPQFTNLKLLELSDKGEFTGQMDMSYFGGFRVEIETEATISVSARLKPLKVNLVLALVCNSISGQMLVKIKPPPSNRVWVGFYHTPNLDLKIEPIVQETHLKFSVIIQAIQRRIMDLLNESMVLPNMEDYPFFPSFGTGGIFNCQRATELAPINPENKDKPSDSSANVSGTDSKPESEESTNLTVNTSSTNEGNLSKLNSSSSTAAIGSSYATEPVEVSDPILSDHITNSPGEQNKILNGPPSPTSSNSSDTIVRSRSLFSKSNREQLSTTASSLNSRLTTIGASYLSSLRKNTSSSYLKSSNASASTNNLIDLKDDIKEESPKEKDPTPDAQQLFKKYHIKNESKSKASNDQPNIFIHDGGIQVDFNTDTQLDATPVEVSIDSNADLPSLTVPPSAEHKPLVNETNEKSNRVNRQNRQSLNDLLMTDTLILSKNNGFATGNDDLSPPPPAAVSLSTSADASQSRRHSNTNSPTILPTKDGSISHSRTKSFPTELELNQDDQLDLHDARVTQPPLPSAATMPAISNKNGTVEDSNRRGFLSNWTGAIQANGKSTFNTLRTRYAGSLANRRANPDHGGDPQEVEQAM